MLKKLIETVELLGYEIYQQGTLNPDEKYPDSFFTFWNFQADENSEFDNEANSCLWGYWLYFYSTDPVLVESELLKAKKELKKAGFEIWGNGEDVASSIPTQTGRMLTIYYKETY